MVQDHVGGVGDPNEARAVATQDPAQPGGDVRWARDSILFSSCNEDSACELRAFGELSGKRVFCVTAGGGRVLNLLIGRPESIWAVDLNPAQNALLELKVAAMGALDHAAYLGFLGVHDSTSRASTYAAVRGDMSSAAQRFFDEQPDLIAAGVLFQGRLERYLRRLAKVLQLLQRFGVRRLFAFDDIAAQRRFVDDLDSLVFRTLAQTACRRSVLGLLSGDPGFYRYVPEEIALHEAIYRAVLDHFRNRLARDNPLMQLIFFGRFIHEPALPIYLNAATYDRVKDALSRVRLVIETGTVNQALAEAGAAAFDAFSLSDISSYLDDAAHAQLFADVLAAASPGARVCSRSNLYHRPLLPEHARRLTRDHDLERELAVADHSCVHKFVVGTVR